MEYTFFIWSRIFRLVLLPADFGSIISGLAAVFCFVQSILRFLVLDGAKGCSIRGQQGRGNHLSAIKVFVKIVFCSMLAVAALALRPAFSEAPLFTVLSADGKVRFDVTDAVIERVGLKTLRSVLPSTDEPDSQVRGPLLRDILAAAGLSGTLVTVRALDGYEMDIPQEDYAKTDLVLAVEVNGKRLSRRERGPAWIAYPSVEFPRFQTDIYMARSVWQVKEIIVK